MSPLPTLDGRSLVCRANGLTFAEIDRGIALLSIRRGNYYSLDDVGAHVWKLLECPVRVCDLCATLQQTYEVSDNQCLTEVLQLLESLAAENLIEVAVEHDSRSD